MKKIALAISVLVLIISCKGKPAPLPFTSNPLLIGKWSVRYSLGTDKKWNSLTTGPEALIQFNEDGTSTGLKSICGCLDATSYVQKNNKIIFLNFSGISCPTIAACQPEPEAEIVSLSEDSLTLARNDYYVFKYVRVK